MARELGIEDIFLTLSQAGLEMVASQYGLHPSDGVLIPAPAQHIKDPPHIRWVFMSQLWRQAFASQSPSFLKI